MKIQRGYLFFNDNTVKRSLKTSFDLIPILINMNVCNLMNQSTSYQTCWNSVELFEGKLNTSFSCDSLLHKIPLRIVFSFQTKIQIHKYEELRKKLIINIIIVHFTIIEGNTE